MLLYTPKGSGLDIKPDSHPAFKAKAKSLSGPARRLTVSDGSSSFLAIGLSVNSQPSLPGGGHGSFQNLDSVQLPYRPSSCMSRSLPRTSAPAWNRIFCGRLLKASGPAPPPRSRPDGSHRGQASTLGTAPAPSSQHPGGFLNRLPGTEGQGPEEHHAPPTPRGPSGPPAQPGLTPRSVPPGSARRQRQHVADICFFNTILFLFLQSSLPLTWGSNLQPEMESRALPPEPAGAPRQPSVKPHLLPLFGSTQKSWHLHNRKVRVKDRWFEILPNDPQVRKFGKKRKKCHKGRRAGHAAVNHTFPRESRTSGPSSSLRPASGLDPNPGRTRLPRQAL